MTGDQPEPSPATAPAPAAGYHHAGALGDWVGPDDPVADPCPVNVWRCCEEPPGYGTYSSSLDGYY